MQSPLAAIVVLTTLMSLGSSARLETRDSSELDPGIRTARQIRWPKKTIEVAFSSSLLSPAPQIKSGSDVVGAARRALSRWSSMANINFVVTWSPLASVSPSSGGDGISLITVADTPDNEAFNADSTAARTRVFFDPETGAIAEADISINPHPRSEEGADLQFSTDGTPGTYDLEATFTHEIGHLLGLSDSAVLASSMQGRQAFNGTFGLPALTERTLNEDDRQRVRSLYGPTQRLGRIEGRVFDSFSTNSLAPLAAVTVWAENIATGRVVVSDITTEDGSYQLPGLTPGQYRVLAEPRTEVASQEASNSGQGVAAAAALHKKFRSFELSNRVAVKPDMVTSLNYDVVPPQSLASTLNPRWIGLKGELSTVALPIQPGRRIKIYLGGEGIDQVPGTSISIDSPYFAVDPSSLAREQLGTPFPVISFDLNVAANAPFGDYTVRLQSNSGELAYIPGAITIDPAVNSVVSNPVDDSRFFVTQQYLDSFGRSPDATSIDKFVALVSQCTTKSECLRARRMDLSTSIFSESISESSFINGLYTAGLGRRPRFNEFENDRTVLLKGNALEGDQLTLAAAFVQRPDFESRYPVTMRAGEFVDSLVLSIVQNTGLDISTDKESLMGLFDGTNQGRAAILESVASNRRFAEAQFNQTLVLSGYFIYLRRNPDDGEFASGLNLLKGKPVRDAAVRSMVCSFLTTEEYQSRFGMIATHNSSECN